jgi:alanine dehydrogenase
VDSQNPQNAPSALQMLETLHALAIERFNGGVAMPPKQSIHLGPGHFFQTMSASSIRRQVAVCKWIGLTVGQNGLGQQTHAHMFVSDLLTGRLLATLNATALTFERTVALTVLAFKLSLKPPPETVGFVGAGRQATAHLRALLSLYPTIHTIHVAAPSLKLDSPFAELVRERPGLELCVDYDASALLAESDFIVTSVPGSSKALGTLDATKTRDDVFISAVDLGRSWAAASIESSAMRMVTDDLEQTRSLMGRGEYPLALPLETDLPTLAATSPTQCASRTMFSFAGSAYADLAAAITSLEIGGLLPIGATER